MKVEKTLVRAVAKTARLNLTEEEVDQLSKEMTDVLTAFSTLKHAPTKEVPPSYHPVPLKRALRKDEEGACLNPEDVLKLAPHKQGHFLGPRI